MRKFVIDTSIFVNPQVSRAFGPNPRKAVSGFLRLASRKRDAEFYMPSSIFSELRNFVHEDVGKLELLVKRRSPNVYAIYLPAAVFYDFIEEVRERVNKGLRLAETFARDKGGGSPGKMRTLREKYKEAMRAGILDSKEDFELVLLAKELDAALVSADEGVLDFANKIGCEILHASKFRSALAKK
ncbi:MAG: RNA ligase partner protein [Candidatus ainarchaeum sp.]|nr:RNA ligase partner protein [Candidatus ainarchaeum sp.]